MTLEVNELKWGRKQIVRDRYTANVREMSENCNYSMATKTKKTLVYTGSGPGRMQFAFTNEFYLLGMNRIGKKIVIKGDVQLQQRQIIIIQPYKIGVL